MTTPGGTSFRDLIADAMADDYASLDPMGVYGGWTGSLHTVLELYGAVVADLRADHRARDLGYDSLYRLDVVLDGHPDRDGSVAVRVGVRRYVLPASHDDAVERLCGFPGCEERPLVDDLAAEVCAHHLGCSPYAPHNGHSLEGAAQSLDTIDEALQRQREHLDGSLHASRDARARLAKENEPTTTRTRPKVSERLLKRLREAGLDIPQDARLVRVAAYSSPAQRSNGCWSWTVADTYGRPLTKDSAGHPMAIGSQYPMTMLLRTGFEVSRDTYGDICIDPPLTAVQGGQPTQED